MRFLLITLLLFHQAIAEPLYSARGIGGGGALAGFSISPFNDLRFVGTDMGTLFRSVNAGKTWEPIRHTQTRYDSDLTNAAEVGFSSDPNIIFFANAGKTPKRSADAGITWKPIPIALAEKERIKYFTAHYSSKMPLVLCGTTEGLWKSVNYGETWSRIKIVQGQAQGTVILGSEKNVRIFHAISNAIFISDDQALTFRSWYTPEQKMRAFTGGIDQKGTTLAWIDSNSKGACVAEKDVNECGYIWIHHANDLTAAAKFLSTPKEGGRFIRMATNDSETIYVTGGDWPKQYGSKIWVSKDAGKTWALKFQIYNWDKSPYQPWPKDKLEYSAVGLDVGWDDNAPFSFAVNPKNSKEAGGTGHYFLHVTKDTGDHWSAPFTEYADQGEKVRGKKWKSTGLEVTSILRLKFHPKNPKLGYASVADVGGFVTEDGGQSWRINKVKYNTNYDYAFDPAKTERVYAASGNQHDFPLNFNTPVKSEGGIFVSDDKGKSWKRLTPENEKFNRQFLSIAYDPIHKIIYGGTESVGVVRSIDEGRTWEYFNQGLPKGDLVIPHIQIDPVDGTAYALLTGNAPEFKNSADSGIYKLVKNSWTLLRENVIRPKEVDAKYTLWNFPSAFAIDLNDSKRETFWLTDIENKGAWLATGAWKTIDGGKTWNRMVQSTHPTDVTLVPGTETVVVSGLYDVTGNWGKGGALVSTDSGKTWKKNESLPLLANLFSFTPDPKNTKNGFYLFFGGGMMYGPILPMKLIK